MTLSLLISSFLVLAAVLTCATADDLVALKATLQKLCYANKNGIYAACCTANNNGRDVKAINAIPACFGLATTTGGIITRLFVPTSMCSWMFFELPSSIMNKGLTAIPSGVFSGLPLLESL